MSFGITPRRRLTFAAIAAAITVAVLAAVSIAASGAGALAAAKPKKPATATKRVSVRSNGKEVNADNDFGAVSGDGRFVTFESVGKFTGGDDGFDDDVFRRDRKTGRTTRVSVLPSGKEFVGASAADSSISSNGRFVAFLSDGAMVPGDANGTLDVYVKDMKTGKVRRASVRSNGSEVVADALNPAISGNGRFVVFDSEGPFVGADTNGIGDIFRHDLKTGKTIRADIRSDGSPTAKDFYGFGESENPTISADGNVIAFESTDSPLVPTSDYGFFGDKDIYARNISQGTTVRVSLKADGGEASGTNNQTNKFPVISANGRFVAFAADEYGSFVVADTNNQPDVYVRDLKSGAISRASVKSDGSEVLDASGVDAPSAISADGRFVAFESRGKLVDADTNMLRDIYLRDRKLGKTKRVSVTTKRKGVDGFAHQLPAISADGKWVAFSSQGKFTGGDTGVDFDVFERGPLR